MVEKNNPMFKVLVTESGTTEEANGGSLADVSTNHTFAFVNFDDNTTFDSTHVPTNLSRMYLAMGRSDADQLFKSAGEYIDVAGVYDVTKVACSASQAQIVDVAMGTANCSDNYGLRIGFQNGEIMYINGVNPLVKSYVVAPDCPEDDCSCPEGNCVQVSFDLATQMGLDPDGLFTVEVGYYENPTGLATGHGYSADDIYAFTSVATKVAWDALVAGATSLIDGNGDGTLDTALTNTDCPIIRITTVPAALSTYCAMNLNYTPLPETKITVAGVDGMVVNGSTITEIQALAYAQGSGYNVRMLEYIAGGFNGDPGVLRMSATYGAGSMNFTPHASTSASYYMYYFSYNNSVNGGWGAYQDTMRTILAVEVDDCENPTTDPQALITAIDGMICALSAEYNFHTTGVTCS